MLNEGIVLSDDKASIKSVMVDRIRQLKEATPDAWERAVFRVLTGHEREEIDWEFEDNQAGYYTWIKAFDGLITELIEDGYVLVEERDGNRILKATPMEPGPNWSPGVGPSKE